MLQNGILNPGILSLLARIRHTNYLVIADWAFPHWTEIEVVDITLCRGIPTIPQVFDLLKTNFKVGEIFMAQEFNSANDARKRKEFLAMFGTIKPTFEPHLDFKKRVPRAIGLIRTGDTTAYGNMILESA